MSGARGRHLAAAGLIGYVRLGLNYERNQALLHSTAIGALSVVGVLVVVAIIFTLLLT